MNIVQEIGSNPPNINVLIKISLVKMNFQALEVKVCVSGHIVD